MKLRVHGNTMRLRLSRPEVTRLAVGGFIEEAARFGPAACLRYRVEASPSAPAIAASFEEGRITVLIPGQAAADWAGSDEEGLYHDQAVTSDQTLSIAIEKDFRCLTGEPDPDAFPNPAKKC